MARGKPPANGTKDSTATSVTQTILSAIPFRRTGLSALQPARPAIRQGQWKYLPNLALADGWQSGPKKPNQPAQPALFDLSTDQGETRNLAQQTALRDSALLQSGASSQVVSEAKDKPAIARRMAELLEKAQSAKSTRPSSP